VFVHSPPGGSSRGLDGAPGPLGAGRLVWTGGSDAGCRCRCRCRGPPSGTVASGFTAGFTHQLTGFVDGLSRSPRTASAASAAASRPLAPMGTPWGLQSGAPDPSGPGGRGGRDGVSPAHCGSDPLPWLSRRASSKSSAGSPARQSVRGRPRAASRRFSCPARPPRHHAQPGISVRRTAATTAVDTPPSTDRSEEPRNRVGPTWAPTRSGSQHSDYGVAAGERPHGRVARAGVEPPTFRFSGQRSVTALCAECSAVLFVTISGCLAPFSEWQSGTTASRPRRVAPLQHHGPATPLPDRWYPLVFGAWVQRQRDYSAVRAATVGLWLVR
jgi:hypothetical protein